MIVELGMGGLDSFESLGPFCCRTWLLPNLGADLKARTRRPTNTRPFGLADLTLMLRLGVVLKIIIFLKILGWDPVGKRLGALNSAGGQHTFAFGRGRSSRRVILFKIIKRSNWVYVSNPKSKSFLLVVPIATEPIWDLGRLHYPKSW